MGTPTQAQAAKPARGEERFGDVAPSRAETRDGRGRFGKKREGAEDAAAPRKFRGDAQDDEGRGADERGHERHAKPQFERPARTGREAGFTTVFFNVGRKELVTPADLVGKIAGVTRLPASIVGAIDIHQRHALVDVASEHAELVIGKLAGIRVRGQALKPARATEAGE
jgi:ATP-dependent RNA helicase DeaD